MTSATQPRDLDVFACALDSRQLIEASAGTGKTWTICALYLRLLFEKSLPVQKILVVTYTNAAAAELRERIRSRLVELIALLRHGRPAGDGDVLTHGLLAAADAMLDRQGLLAVLETALQNFDEAAIFTIHGFCQRALADTPFTAGLPFRQDLLRDDRLLRQQVVNDFWRRRVANTPLPTGLADHLLLAGDCPQTWSSLLRRQLGKPRSLTLWPAELDTPAVLDRAALEAAFEAARHAWSDGRAPSEVLRNALSTLDGRSFKAEILPVAARNWSAWLATGQPLQIPDDDKLTLFTTATIVGKTKKNHRPPTHPFFDAADVLLAAHRRAVGVLQIQRLRLLRDLFDTASAALREEKRRRRVFSFDDMLYNLDAALRAGEPPWLAAALRERYPAALIDEFQDTDPLQYAIFQAIYGADDKRPASPLFLVGDPKQAIYSFRNADLPTYLAASRESGPPYTLRENQRSTSGLIDACNALFGANPQAFILDGLQYQSVSAGRAARAPLNDRSEDGAQAALCVWQLPEENGENPTRQRAGEAVLRATAGEVARLLAAAQAGKIHIGDRPLRPGDIAILVERHAQGRLLREALQAAGVACSELSQRSVFATTDAADLETVLQAIIDPGRPAVLNRALASELMGYEATAIDSLSADQPRLLQIVTRFAAYREIWCRRGFGVMLRQWMNDEDIAGRLLARSDGERRLTNLLHLGELLQQADVDQPAPDALLRWLNGRRDGDAAIDDDVAQLRLESDQNLVQIVTIHKAKGLEYGIVFCPFLWDGQTTTRPRGEGREYHDDDGRPVIDFRPALDENEQNKIDQHRREERAAESVRLIYVALTRAVHRCYLVAGLYRTPTANGRPTLTRSSRSTLNWLVAGAGLSYPEWQQHKRSAAEIDEAWRCWAVAAGTSVAWQRLPDRTPSPLLTLAPAPDSLRARTPPTRINPGWRLGSFSSLQHGAESEIAASDHDGQATAVDGDGEAPAPVSELAADDILHFPRGASAGDCLHALFERIDFTDAAQWPEAIDYVLARHPQTPPGPPSNPLSERLPAMLRRLLFDVLSTPLPDGLLLANIGRSQRLVELTFNLPTAPLSPTTLNAWLTEHGYVMPRLAFQPLSGYLKGYIDLIVHHRGRYYLIDWKSNHLGPRQADYHQARLAEAMNQHGYHLQYLLYGIALQRYLRRRLADYDHERHFGGVLYLFVRGVRPGWLESGWPDGPRPCGVYYHRPGGETLDSLDALLSGKRVSGPRCADRSTGLGRPDGSDDSLLMHTPPNDFHRDG
ncbi:MAG: exodeoxyribonuclease V subunit beta [Candidatus Accumulibacter sp.]|nr:exodeoxyribonuclease V subunit beta [Accumulibacter sp.]